MKLSRRGLLGSSLALPWAAVLAPRRASAGPPLVTDPAGLLDLPAGFTYTILETAGDAMTDGYVVPALPDGMGLFVVGSELVLMRNHELFATQPGPYPTPADAPPEAYDVNEMGCVTRLVLDGTTYARLRSNLVLCGTKRNCSGGAANGSWLSCEETVAPRWHGFVFACDPTAELVQPASRLILMGRFNHEAAAWDPTTLETYLTEDRLDGCLYRQHPTNGLFALKIVGISNFDTGLMGPGDLQPVEWVRITVPNPATDTVRTEAYGLGAALVRRGEGLTALGRSFTFSATAGGPIARGQLLTYHADTMELECVASSANPALLDMPDNLVVAPWSQIFLGENGPMPNRLRCLTSTGAFCDVAQCPTSELSGVCFAPAGDALFVNLQQDGLTVRIDGPFQATFDV